jgi:nitroreductase
MNPSHVSPLEPSRILDAMRWRYATKRFDPARRIPDETWGALEETLVLSPSSYGLQPWEFLVVTRQDLKESLVPATWGQRQVADCSHLLVIAARVTLAEADIDRLMGVIESVQGRSRESTRGYRDMMMRDVVEGPRSRDIRGWAKLQCYIALGNFMTAAALLGIDTCPMEGFQAEKYDEALGLPASGLTAAVLCPAGYRHPEDKYAALPKVRYPAAELIRRVG